MPAYAERFWKKNWDEGVEDLEPQEFETTYVEMIMEAFEKVPDKIALAFLGVDITFRQVDVYANQFAHMLKANGFEKGDVVGINLPNIPDYVVSLIGALRAGCIVSGVSPLLSADQIKYQLNDLGSTGRKVALVTLDAIFAGHIVKIANDIPQLKLVVATSVAGFLPKIKQVSS
jgi:long-chain acyl-CoA synthetase